jgi:hypothetical protein
VEPGGVGLRYRCGAHQLRVVALGIAPAEAELGFRAGPSGKSAQPVLALVPLMP